MEDEKSGLTGNNLKGYADALESAYRLVKQIIADANDLLDKQGRSNRIEITDELGVLRFEPEKFRRLLQAITDGNFVAADLQRIEGLLAETAEEVYRSMYNIKYEDRAALERRYGKTYWNTLENDVQEMKGTIRHELEQLARMKGKSKQQIQQAAQIIEDKIVQFNDNLAKACDLVVPPKRMRTAP